MTGAVADLRTTTARQEALVGEGLSLGCIALGVRVLSSDADVLGDALCVAWALWPAAAAFPQVKGADPSRHVLQQLLVTHQRRPDVTASWLYEHGELSPVVRLEGWGLEDVAAHVTSVTGVAAPTWVGLADRILLELPEHDVHRW